MPPGFLGSFALVLLQKTDEWPSCWVWTEVGSGRVLAEVGSRWIIMTTNNVIIWLHGDPSASRRTWAPGCPWSFRFWQQRTSRSLRGPRDARPQGIAHAE